MTENVLYEPPVAGDEIDTLLGSLDRQRRIFAWKCGGLGAAGLGRLAAYTGSRGESPSLRRLLIDMIEEYACHAGHADLIRESVDGLVGEDQPAG
ncbi:DUF664 domain-containing protein [Microbispora bryophytorum]|uniref:mycothiol transferase n=1 Tax=Microbispora bryophytorum TaxID=1460882 RepID=UPI0033C59BBD